MQSFASAVQPRSTGLTSCCSLRERGLPLYNWDITYWSVSTT